MKLELVQITESGRPAQPSGELPPIAQEVCIATEALYLARGFQRPWVGYFALKEDEEGHSKLVGTCAFTSAPVEGIVEIAYFTFPEFEGRGYATIMAQMLVDLAQEHLPSIIVIAYTLPHSNASTSILKKLGFELQGAINHPEDGLVWLWQLKGRSV